MITFIAYLVKIRTKKKLINVLVFYFLAAYSLRNQFLLDVCTVDYLKAMHVITYGTLIEIFEIYTY